MLRLTDNIPQFRKAFDALTITMMPNVIAGALNDTAYDGLDAVKDEMRDEFDRPTSFTLNAFMVWRADARNLEAQIKMRNSAGSRHYLKVENAGGARPGTGIEGALKSRLAYAGLIEGVTPAKGAKRDANGNWSGGQRNQLLSGLGAQKDASSNTSAASKKLAKNRKRGQFFVPKPGSGLSPGVWVREGEQITKVLHFTKGRPTYRRRTDYLKNVTAKAGKVYEKHIARRLAAAL